MTVTTVTSTTVSTSANTAAPVPADQILIPAEAVAPAVPGRLSGADALMDALHRHGVTDVFGYPGGAILPIYDALHKAESRGWLKHVLVRHEQGAPTPLTLTPGPPAG